MRKTIEELFNEFLYECEFAKRSKKETLRGYSQVVQLFLKLNPGISHALITKQTIIDFFRIIQQRKRVVGRGSLRSGVKNSTIATYWSKLNCFFQWLTLHKHIESNPFDHIPYPTPSYEDRKFLHKEEIERILTAIYTHHNNSPMILKRNIVLFYVLLFCGLRREELLDLQVRDVDFGRKQLTVRGITSKSGRDRQLPLHSVVLMHLKDFLVSRKKYTCPYLMIANGRDEQLTMHGLKHLIQRLRNYSGVNFHLHQFRHTFAVNFLKSSNNIAKLKQLLGHKSIMMTLTYLRCLPTEEIRDDIENMRIDNFI
jgi:site-specific recombinase XerD